MKKLALIFFLVLSCVCSYAYDFKVGGIYYTKTSTTAPYTVEITYNGSSYSCANSIPASVTYNGTTYTITSIDSYAFMYCQSLRHVTIPNSVTSIGYSAFSGCTSLTSVVIPNSVTTIGNYAFSGCTALDSITIGSAVTSIGTGTFQNCNAIRAIYYNARNLTTHNDCFRNRTTLTNLIIGENVQALPSYIFAGCTSLQFVTIPNSVTSIGSYAFSDCTALDNVSIGNSVTSINSYAFQNCSRLQSIIIPNSVTTIGNYAFSGCTALDSVSLGNSVTSINSYAFKNCNAIRAIHYNAKNLTTHSNCFQGRANLTTLILGNNVQSLPASIFQNCTGIQSVTIPNSVTSIGNYAFSDCSVLDSISIGSSVTSIGTDAFKNCNAIRAIYYNARNLTTHNDCFRNRTNLTTLIIGDSVLSLPANIFQSCTALDSICIGSSVTSIGTDAFKNCNAIRAIHYNAKKLTTHNNCFKSRVSLTTLTIGDSVKSLPANIFQDCTGLSSVAIPNSVTTIGGYAFSGCTALDSVTIGSVVTSIGYYAFQNCSRLQSIIIPNSVTTIGSYAFSGCSALNSITIPNSVTSIGASAFQSCTSLNYLTIPNSVTSIGDYAFSGCTALDSLSIGNAVTSIGTYAFQNCTSLPSVTIPNSVTTIGNNAFQSCTSLDSVVIPNSVTSIGASAFQGCTDLQYLSLGTSIEADNGNVFTNCTNLRKIDYNVRNWRSVSNYFQNQQHLTEVAIGDSVLRMPESLFADNENLRKITIGKGVNIFYDNVFRDCIQVDTIICHSDIPPTIQATTFSNINQFIPVYIPCGSKERYQSAEHWRNFRNFIEEGCEYRFLYLFTNSSIMGSVSGAGTYPAGSTDTIRATANQHYRFMQWSDGNTDNPRAITLTQDTAFTAIFHEAGFYLMVQTNNATMGNVSGNGIFPEYATRTIEALPYHDYRFVQWSDGNTDNPRVVSLSQDTLFIALFAPIDYYITVNAANSTTGSVSGNGYYPSGSTATLTAFPFNGYQFTQWDDGSTDNPRTVIVTSDRTYTAHFAPCHIVTVSSSDELMGTAYGSGFYATNASATLIAIPNTGYRFAHWNDGSTSPTRAITVVSDTLCTATFEVANYHIAALSSNPTMGSAYGSGYYAANASATLVAIANTGYHFSHWSDGSTDNPRTITATADSTFTAHFAISTFRVTAQSSSPAQGSVYGSGHYAGNTAATLTAIANTGWQFSHWNDDSTDNPRTLTVTSDTTLIALFAAATYRVTAQSSNLTMGSTSGSGSYANGASATLTALPNTGYLFSHWHDGSTDNPRAITVTSDTTLTALFSVANYFVAALTLSEEQGSAFGSGYYAAGSTATLVAIPNTGYHFVQWSDGNTDNPRTIEITGNITYTAIFATSSYLVTATSSEDAHGAVFGGGYYAAGSTATLMAVPNAGYQFHHWDDGSTLNPRQLAVTSDTALSAVFAAQHLVTVMSHDESMGIATGGGYYAAGAQVVLSANAHAGYRFVQWSDGNTHNPRIVTVTSDELFTAQFDVAGYNVATLANDDAMGTVYGGGYIAANTQTSLLAVPNAGYVFTRWSDGGTANPRSATITQDTTFTALFEQYGYYVTAASGDEAQGTVYGSGYYPAGSEAYLIASANAGHRFEHWSDGDESNPRIFPVTEDVTLTATFSDQFRVTVLSGNELMGTTHGSGTYTYGRQAIIGATAHSRYRFVQWSDGNTDNPRIFTVVTDSVFTAQFAEATAIDDCAGTDLRIYPNPTKDVIHIVGDGISKVELFDLQGKKLMESIERNLNLTHLPAGCYLLRIATADGVVNRRVVKSEE